METNSLKRNKTLFNSNSNSYNNEICEKNEKKELNKNYNKKEQIRKNSLDII